MQLRANVIITSHTKLQIYETFYKTISSVCGGVGGNCDEPLVFASLVDAVMELLLLLLTCGREGVNGCVKVPFVTGEP